MLRIKNCRWASIKTLIIAQSSQLTGHTVFDSVIRQICHLPVGWLIASRVEANTKWVTELLHPQDSWPRIREALWIGLDTPLTLEALQVFAYASRLISIRTSSGTVGVSVDVSAHPAVGLITVLELCGEVPGCLLVLMFSFRCDIGGSVVDGRADANVLAVEVFRNAESGVTDEDFVTFGNLGEPVSCDLKLDRCGAACTDETSPRHAGWSCACWLTGAATATWCCWSWSMRGLPAIGSHGGRPGRSERHPRLAGLV